VGGDIKTVAALKELPAVAIVAPMIGQETIGGMTLDTDTGVIIYITMTEV